MSRTVQEFRVPGAEPLERPLPKNLDAERAVLGAILLDNAKLKAAAEIINSGDFFSPNGAMQCSNGILFAQMLAMAGTGQDIDLLTLTDFLERKHQLAHIDGGAGYISGLMDGVPRISNVEHYARIVKEKSVRRGLIHATHSIEQQAFEGEEDLFAILGRARLALGQLADQQQDYDIFDTWEEFQNAKPLRSLIEGFLQADVANVLGGLSGHAKTWIAMATVKALLTGESLFGHFRVVQPLERCIYLIPECARTPFYHRVQMFGLEPYIKNGRLLVRTLSKGRPVQLDDFHLLRHVRDAHIAIDPAVRFLEGDENSAGDVARGFGTNVLGLLSHGAADIHVLQHSPKSFERENYITLENCLRGSGDFGAFVGAGFGIRQIDPALNIVHLENIKPRDGILLPPFQIIGRPSPDRSYIAEEHDFRIHLLPEFCGKLADYVGDLPGRNKGGGASKAGRQAKASHKELVRQYLSAEPRLSDNQIVEKLKTANIEASRTTILRDRKELGL